MNILLLKENKKNCIVFPNEDLQSLCKIHNIFIEKNYGANLKISDEKYLSIGCKIIDKEMLKNINIFFKLSKLKNNQFKYFSNNEKVLISNVPIANNPGYLLKLMKHAITSISIEILNHSGHYFFFEKNEWIKGLFAIKVGNDLNKKTINEIKKYKFDLSQEYYIDRKLQYVVLNYSYASYECIFSILNKGGKVILLEENKEYIDLIKNDKALQELIKDFGGSLEIYNSDFDTLIQRIKHANVLINTTTNPTDKTHLRITKDMIDSLAPGAVYIDLGADQGFGSEISKKPNTIKKPYSIIKNKYVSIVLENIRNLDLNFSSKELTRKICEILNLFSNDMTHDLHNNKTIKTGLVTYGKDVVNGEIASVLNIKYKKI